MQPISTDALGEMIGREVGVSDWAALDQNRINQFADATEDHQFIHVDPERACAETPFGGTIAHGFLTLSMLSHLIYGVGVTLEGAVMGINYGLEKVRFLQPVRAGQRIRARFVLKDAHERKPGSWLMRYEVTVEIDGEDKPALAADWLGMQVIG